ncbi:MAG: LptE family protein [Bacteroidales bacterium]|nr:LptE family protein [Bacteroidales bacterium]MBP5317091.1 LptE family protein [Bacteroidales bacterium]
MRKTACILTMVLCLAALSSCGIYSFSGTSIKPDVQTITIEPVVNNALKVNPTLANTFTESLKDKFKKLTSLKDVEEDGDLQLTVTIESYDVRAQAITANEVAAQNRLTITAKATFINVLHPEENFENKQFAAFQDYNSELSLDAVEAALCDDIVETLVEDIFNASVAQW